MFSYCFGWKQEDVLSLTLPQYISYLNGIGKIKRAENGTADPEIEQVKMRNQTKLLEAQVELKKKMTGKSEFQLNEIIK